VLLSNLYFRVRPLKIQCTGWKKKVPKACANLNTTASICNMMIIYPENINQILEISLDSNQLFIGQFRDVTFQDLAMSQDIHKTIAICLSNVCLACPLLLWSIPLHGCSVKHVRKNCISNMCQQGYNNTSYNCKLARQGNIITTYIYLYRVCSC